MSDPAMAIPLWLVLYIYKICGSRVTGDLLGGGVCLVSPHTPSGYRLNPLLGAFACWTSPWAHPVSYDLGWASGVSWLSLVLRGLHGTSQLEGHKFPPGHCVTWELVTEGVCPVSASLFDVSESLAFLPFSSFCHPSAAIQQVFLFCVFVSKVGLHYGTKADPKAVILLLQSPRC